MLDLICVAPAPIVRFSQHPKGQTSRKIGTQSVESRHFGMVALPGSAVGDGTPEWIRNHTRSVGGHP